MSRPGKKGKRARQRAAWADLLGAEDLSGVTELEKFTPVRVDAVEVPATGAPVLVMKAALSGSPGIPGGVSVADEELAGYALTICKSAPDGQTRRTAEDLLERLGLGEYAYDIVAKSHRSAPDAEVRLASRLVKSEAPRRYTLLVAYPAFRPDRQRAQDGHRDAASAAAVEQAAWEYLAKHRAIGLWHDDGPATEGAGTVVESYIYRPGKPWVVKAADGSKFRVCQGDWLLGVVWQPDVWERHITTGKARGVSMMGSALRRPLSPATAARIRERGAA